MSRFVPVAPLAELPSGARKLVVAGPWEIAVFNVGGSLRAVENTCPHQGAPLIEGWVDEGCVTCPWHAWTFELESGKMTLGDYTEIETFEVRVEDGMVLVATEPRRKKEEG